MNKYRYMYICMYYNPYLKLIINTMQIWDQPRVRQLHGAALPRFPGHARLIGFPLRAWLQRLPHLPGNLIHKHLQFIGLVSIKITTRLL